VPGKVGGVWLFKGTRVPVKALFENLESGARLDEFLEWFPGVTREQVELVVSGGHGWAGVRILFDQGTPVPLRRALAGHTISTAFEMGWSELDNGALLQAAESRFDALITTDKNLRYQQNLTGLRLAIVVLPTTSWPRIQAHLAQVVTAVNGLRPGLVAELTFS
jgi:hypothetical protein